MEAFDFVKGASDTLNSQGTSSTHIYYPITNFIRCMLANGKEKGVRNWHLKLLCGILLVMKDLLVSQYPISNRVEVNHNSDAEASLSIFSDKKGRYLVADYLTWCQKVFGQEDIFLSSFRLQFYKYLKSLNSNEIETFLTSVHQVCYGKPMDEEKLSSLRTRAMHPFQFILQLLCDNHLQTPEALSNIFKDGVQSIPKDFEFNLKNIVFDDFPSRYKREAKVGYKVVPTKEGFIVKHGECLIINQTFKNDEKMKRHGTEKDVRQLIKSMNEIGCRNRMMIKNDVSKKEMFDCIAEFKEKIQHSLPDFIVVVILSHGKQNVTTGQDEILDIHSNGIPISKIRNKFIDGTKCPAMIGKPKIFFIQACRGKGEQTASRAMYRYISDLEDLQYYSQFKLNDAK